MHLGFLLLAALAALARSSCPGAVDALPSFDHVVMNEGAIPLQSDRLLDVWHTFKLTLPSARALRVKVNPSAQALADDWKVVLCPECPQYMPAFLFALCFFHCGSAANAAASMPSAARKSSGLRCCSLWSARTPSGTLVWSVCKGKML